MPHGFCMRWEPGLLWLHVVSDVLIALAYFSIPLALIMFVRRRSDMKFGFIFWLFAAFILSCGITHVVSIFTLWYPDYWTEGVFKALCAAVSVATAILLWPILPKALRIPSSAKLQEANEKLQAANAELRHSAEVNQRLANDARQSERAKEQFLAVMSHEVRTPLNAMLGMSTLLLETGSMSSEQEDYLRTIRNSGEALNVLIGDILDYTKLDSRDVELRLEPCLIAETVTIAIEMLAGEIEAAGLEVGLQVAPDVPKGLCTDAQRVQQIVLNLIRNAVKFTESGGIFLELAVDRKGPAQMELIIFVRDTGIGMDEAEQTGLFQPFYQANRSLQRHHEGVGLGLAIVKRISERMGGSVSVKSLKGAGTTFCVRLPVEEAEMALRIPSEGIHMVSARDTIAETVDSVLTHFGLKVDVSESVESALEKMGTSGWILVDYVFGLEALRLVEKTGKARCWLLTPVDRCRSELNPADFGGTVSYPPRLEAFGIGAVKAKETLDKTEFGPLRILVVEDNRTNRKVLNLLLKRAGYTATLTEDGMQGLKEWEAGQYDLVLMDVHMPGLDGISVTQRIRQIESEKGGKRCVIAALTADAHSTTIDRCMEAGMDSVLTKPLRPGELERLLRRTRSRDLAAT